MTIIEANQSRYQRQEMNMYSFYPRPPARIDWMAEMVNRLEWVYREKLNDGRDREQAIAETLSETIAGAGAQAEFLRKLQSTE